MNKRVCVLCLIVVLLIPSISLAKPCPIPVVNSDKAIAFSGFDWYCDYNDVVRIAESIGLVENSFWGALKTGSDVRVTPHWKAVLHSESPVSANSEKGCGAYMTYYDGIPDVAGYKVEKLQLYLMWNSDLGITKYNDPQALQLYMAMYYIDPNDPGLCYEDLKSKLMHLYGDKPHLQTRKTGDGEYEYACWVNSELALIGLAYTSFGVNLLYMAPNAEKRLCEVEEMVKINEITQAEGDYSGL